MQVGLMVSALAGMDPGDLARTAESLEYDALWVGELWHESGVVQLAEMARATETVTLGSAVLNVFSRSPAVLAMTAASLQRASDGRFVLGTGVSTQTAVEDLHGQSFERPVRRAHETLAAVRAFCGEEESVSYDGELIGVEGFPGLDLDVPIYHAGLGPANRRVVGRLADGWLPHNLPFSQLETAFEEVASAAREWDRDPDSITVAPYVPAVVNEDREAALDVLRRHVAYYAGSGEGYRRAVGSVYPDVAATVGERWEAGDREGAAAVVTDEVATDLGIAGPAAHVRERMHSLTDGIVDHPIVVVPLPASEAMATETITSLAPASGP